MIEKREQQKPIRLLSHGVACTKAGEDALQATCGGFDSHLLHNGPLAQLVRASRS